LQAFSSCSCPCLNLHRFIAKGNASATGSYIASAAGALIVDVEGREYIDFAGGIAVMGAKYLKAVVFQGNCKRTLFKPDKITIPCVVGTARELQL